MAKSKVATEEAEASPSALTKAKIIEALDREGVVERMAKSLKSVQFESIPELRRVLKRVAVGTPKDPSGGLLPPALAKLLGFDTAPVEQESTVLTLDCTKLYDAAPEAVLRFVLEFGFYEEPPSVYIGEAKATAGTVILPILMTLKIRAGETKDPTEVRKAAVEVAKVPIGTPISSGVGGPRWSLAGMLPTGHAVVARIVYDDDKGATNGKA